jgi:hypothetical protein
MAESRFADEFLPVYDVSDGVATVARRVVRSRGGRCSMSTF